MKLKFLSLLILLSFANSQIKITGTVIDNESGSPLPLVNIYSSSSDEGGSCSWQAYWRRAAWDEDHTPETESHKAYCWISRAPAVYNLYSPECPSVSPPESPAVPRRPHPSRSMGTPQALRPSRGVDGGGRHPVVEGHVRCVEHLGPSAQCRGRGPVPHGGPSDFWPEPAEFRRAETGPIPPVGLKRTIGCGEAHRGIPSRPDDQQDRPHHPRRLGNRPPRRRQRRACGLHALLRPPVGGPPPRHAHHAR